jgi:formylglycine-generating enzyme required for sulfatase activity
MRYVLLFYFFILSATSIHANNISVANLQRVSTNAAEQYAIIQFSISWDNSWRDTENYDAAWVFLKFRPAGSTNAWSHATLHYVDGTNDGHAAPDGSAITTSTDGKGIFIFRSAVGSGSVNFVNVGLRWDYGVDGLSAGALVDISASAIEMVYVPAGSFWLGDGSNSILQGQFENGVSGLPLQINSEASFQLGGGSPGSLGNNNRTGMANNGFSSISPVSIDDFDDVSSQTLPASFPKGYAAFYCMKYEITQAQYADFLTKLSAAQFSTRYDALNYSASHGGFTVTRNNITGIHPAIATATPDLPAIYIEWYDIAAYADWAALRPMTELEFEKACRGPLSAVPNEFAWGNALINNLSYFPINNLGQPNESIGAGYSLVAGNAWYENTRGFNAITRVGIFAAHPSNANRVTAGATYWGIMEMSGHCWERTVSVGRPEGRAFAGSNGDGNLLLNGNASNSDWPGFTPGQGVNTAIGCGYRGGGFNFSSPTQPNLRVSSRLASTAFYNIMYFDDSGRLVRTAQ